MCIFCEIISGNIPGSVVYEDDQVLAILDLA
jgi:diadenosine tetraphosphate (Ap4A) HIT family hydrolase